MDQEYSADALKQTDVIVLAGGMGSRLRGRVPDVPKPMAQVAGRPFLEYILFQLQTAGFGRVILSVGYKHKAIQRHFGQQWGMLDLVYNVETEPLGTGGAIRESLSASRSPDVFILNGDSILDLDFGAMLENHRKTHAAITMALARGVTGGRYGRVELRDGHIVGFSEKSEGANDRPVNGGIYLLQRRKILPLFLSGHSSFEVDVMPRIMKIGLLGHEVDGFFIDIGVVEDFDRAQNEDFFRTRNRDLMNPK